jgi:hypothetical protein
MTKKQGVLLYLAILVFIFSGCSDNTNISKQNEITINSETNNTSTDETFIPSTNNTLTDETLILSTNNILTDSRVKEQNDSSYTYTYSNPIDEYFIPRINDASSGKTSYQDTYRGVWKAEFENILKLLDEKCVYQKDKDDLTAYKNSVEQLIKSTQDVVVTCWLDNYNMPPDTYRHPSGNGTRSALGQIKGEIYRDASMLLIEKMYNLNYKFLDKDYSKEHYE